MVHEILNIDFKTYNYLELTKLLTTILFIAHVFACIFLYEGRISVQNGDEANWLL